MEKTSDNFIRALDKATKWESELLHPEKNIGGYDMGDHMSVTVNTINRVRPQKTHIKVGVKDIVRSATVEK
jgi:hypothetical protein